MMTETWAYAAGLIDGEGTIGLCRQHPAEYRSPFVTVPSTTYELIHFLQVAFGGTVSSKRTYKTGHSKSWVWSIRGNAAINFLDNLLPWMREPEKIRRATMLAHEYKSVTPRNGKYTDEAKTLKRDFEKRFFKYTRQHPVLV
jgi:hypothetical protein